MSCASLARWGGVGLVSALFALPVFASCTSSEDTEPFVPAAEGAQQPSGSGTLLSEADACERAREAAQTAYSRLRCAAPNFAECPSFVRPGGASGCYEYYEDSVVACEKAYADARSCSTLKPCIVAAERNESLETCQLLDPGGGGQGGGAAGGASPGGAGGREASGGQGGSEPLIEAGAPGSGGAGDVPALAGAGGQ